jgi:uncharacterized protein YndB with AHSA1/START domain
MMAGDREPSTRIGRCAVTAKAKHVGHIAVSVPVNAPAEEVWAAITDHERESRYVLATTVRGTKNDGHGVGGELEAFTGFGKIGLLDKMVVTDWEPPHVYRVDHVGEFKGTGAFEIAQAPGGHSVLTWIEDIEIPLGAFGRIGFVIVRPLISAALRYSLQRLAKDVSHPS